LKLLDAFLENLTLEILTKNLQDNSNFQTYWFIMLLGLQQTINGLCHVSHTQLHRLCLYSMWNNSIISSF
jgi:hypothetical protein